MWIRAMSDSGRREAGESAILTSEFSETTKRAGPGALRRRRDQAPGITLPV